MLTLQIIFQSLLAILLIVSSVATFSAGRSLKRLRQERDIAFQMLSVLECASRTAQNETATLYNMLEQLRAVQGVTPHEESLTRARSEAQTGPTALNPKKQASQRPDDPRSGAKTTRPNS